MRFATTRKTIAFAVIAVLLVFSAFPLVGQARDGEADTTSVQTILERLNNLHSQGATGAANELFDSLSIDEQTAVASANQTVRFVVEQVNWVSHPEDQAVNLAGCYGPITHHVYGTNRLGVVTTNFYQQFQWCGNGSTISSAWCSSWAGDLAWGYTWEGHSTYCQVTYGGIDNTSIKSFSQGIFKFCVTSLCTTYQPWIAQQGDPYGNYWVWSVAS